MLFDAHTHLNLAAFDADRDEVVKRTLSSDVYILNVGTCYQTSCQALDMKNKYPKGLWASAGIHPNHAFPFEKDANEISSVSDRIEQEDVDDRFRILASDKNISAIGECGLDDSYLKDFSEDLKEIYKKKEREVFRDQILLAKELNKPLILHVRDLYEEALDMLQTFWPEARGVFHFFTGTKEQAQMILSKGFYIGLSGVITYSQGYDEMIKSLPLDKILIETDAPYVAPVPYRGLRNEPIYVAKTALKISELKNLDFKEISEATVNNTYKFLGI